MTSKTIVSVIGGLLLVGALGAVSFCLQRDNAKLRARAVELQRSTEPVVRLGDENRRTTEFLARVGTDAKQATAVVHDEVVKLRAEVAGLEERARAIAEQRAEAAVRLAANHDPEQGLARLEDFRNVGRGTPGTAVQTLVWAAMKGDEPTLIAAIAVPDDAREKALQVLARLPEATRLKYPTPESLAALMVTGEILRADGAQIVGSTPIDALHAKVTLRLAGGDGDEQVLTELEPDGWRVVVPKKMIARLDTRLKPPGPPAANPAPRK